MRQVLALLVFPTCLLLAVAQTLLLSPATSSIASLQYQGIAPTPPVQTFSWTVAITGRGSVQVTSDPPGISCPGICTYTWQGNLARGLFLTAVPGPTTFTSFHCPGTGVIQQLKPATCNVSQMRPGTSGTTTITLWPQGTPVPGPQPTAIFPNR